MKKIVASVGLVALGASGLYSAPIPGLTEEGGKTRLNMQMLFESAAERDNTARKFGAVEGLNQTLGRLQEHLAKMAGDKS